MLFRSLQARAIARGHARGGLEVESLDLRAQPAHHERVDIGGCATNADDATVPARAGGDDSPGRRLGDRGQDGRALDEAPLRGVGLASASARSTRRKTVATTRATSPSVGAGVGWNTGLRAGGKLYTPSKNRA